MDAKKLGYLGVFVAFYVLLVACFCEGNRRILDKASYGNGLFHLSEHDIEENIV